jgi:adenylate cyclase
VTSPVSHRSLLLLASSLVASGIGISLWATHALRRLELDTVDARFDIRGGRAPPRDIVIVPIDDQTFDDLQVRWPFPRHYHAQVIANIARDHPRAIAYDVQFTEPTDSADDNALIDAVARSGHVALATTEVDSRGHTNVFGGDQVVRQVGARVGNANVLVDPGGVVRRLPLSIDRLASFGVVAAEVAGYHPTHPPHRTLYIDYAGPANTIHRISFSQVYKGRAPPGFFRNRIVVVGAAAPTLQDVHATPLGSGQMSGPELQANAIDTVRRGFPLRQGPGATDVVLIVLLGMIAPIAGLRLRPLAALALALGAGAAFVIAAQLAFNGGAVIAVVYPVAALLVSILIALAVQYSVAAFERARTRAVFARFVPEHVVDDVLARTGDDLRLGAVRREATVMFTDLRGFTSFAEQVPPDRVVEVLNRYLGEMSDAIMAHDGTLVAYMGDGIMAAFGVPLEQPDHADRALAAAREMLKVRLPAFNAWLASEGLGDGFRMGIGLNTGPVMSGNVGSERRLEYTAIGDTTNTASRLEGMTKGTPHQLFLSESTRDRLQHIPSGLVYVDEVEIRGREARLRVWTLASDDSDVKEE